MFSWKAAAGLIKPETLPPTEGAAAQHSLRAYLQTQDWILLQSMSLNPSDYGWTLGVHGYEPVPTLDHMAPEELLQFTSCNCNGDCSNRRCSCKRNGVKCISACGVCKGFSCKNCGHDGGESGEDSEIDS
ncbi:Chromosome-associated kinesin KIF4 [Dissostichus eleginoides]|uniref:Chromosome-associated kinesin KIF4 n=1 Tax=Dissostichus eleginoides TaxID=100907 RepID=A0AAD9C7B0_DISEL|nr:Chromosome-associated kinesin KIF4 [Dissostichus eleginoides]